MRQVPRSRKAADRVPTPEAVPVRPIRAVTEFARRKAEGRPVVMATCYDAAFARVMAESGIDVVLVGDSAAMVVHGHASTVSADTAMMAAHTAAVRRGLGPERFIVADLPFPTHRLGLVRATEAADALMKAGASAVKLEGAEGHLDVVRHLVGSGIPVMGHLGLTPQSVHALGGYKVQGREAAAAKRLLQEARDLEAAGCFSLVLECIPAALAAKVTSALRISTIGIGSGPNCDGQVLVLHDLLGLNPGFKPKFLRTYLDGAALVRGALDRYAADVRGKSFPSAEESF